MRTITGKFVVLLHATCDGEHYDLMLEETENLKTWQFEKFPSAGQTAELIAPHRKAYLDYEGPISKNRGHVTRADSGTFEAEISESEWLIYFHGRRLNGKYSIENNNRTWILTAPQNPFGSS